MNTRRPAPKRRRYTLGVRAQAAEETGRRISDAFLARLMTQWFDEITLDRVAADAGVTVQTVVRRFGGKDGLLAGAVRTFGDRVLATRAAPPGDVARLVANLVADYEQTGDAVLRLLALEERHPSLRGVLDYGRDEHRKWVAAGFGGALAGLDAPRRERALDAIVVVTDVYAWKLLRRDMGRGVAATTSAMRTMVRAVLAEFGKKEPSGEAR
jgi:AcrR family transcriptional regulator